MASANCARRRLSRRVKAETAQSAASPSLDKQLSRFVPLAKSGVKRPMVDPRENRDRFMPVKAKRVRFTIRDTNNLEPCIDELEVFTTAGENIALNAEGDRLGRKSQPPTAMSSAS
jgi:hypothetical protein